MTAQPPASAVPPTALVIASFALTGAEQSRHAATVAAGLRQIGVTPVLMGPDPGGFAEDDLRGLSARPGQQAVIYLRHVLRARPGPGRWVRLRRAVRLWRGARVQRRLVVIRDPWRLNAGVLAQVFLCAALRLAHPWRLRVVRATATPAEVVSALTGLRPVRTDPNMAEAAAFAQILAARPEGMRLSGAHAARALRTANAPAALRRRCAALEPAVARLAPCLPAVLRAIDLSPDPDQPRAIAACLAPGRGGGSRLADHLAHCGQRRTARLDFVLPPGGAPALEGDPVASWLLGRPDLSGQLGDLHAPIGPPGSVSGLEWMILRALRAPMTSLAAYEKPWMRAPWAATLDRVLPPGHPARPRERMSPALTLHGLTAEQTGLGQNLWMSAEALTLAGIPARIESVDAPDAEVIPPNLIVRATVTAPTALYHLNADRIPQVLFSRYRHRTAFHIGFLLWELDRLPAAHMLALDMLDEIWVPSVYLHRLYQRHFPGRVVFMRKGLPRLAPEPVARPDGVFRFLVAFDANSSTARKNPLAAVLAFRAAFSDRRDVELVVKTTPVRPGHWGDPEGQIPAIRALAAQDPRIRLIERHVPFARLLGLIAGADCLISPHRAEGFGYLPAFSQALGTPVVLTDYSGPRDFCTPATSFPVPFARVPVPRGHAIHPTPGARWAEIDREALTATLTAVADDPSEAARRAERGQRLMALGYSMPAQAARYRTRLAQAGLIRPMAAPALDEMFLNCS